MEGLIRVYGEGLVKFITKHCYHRYVDHGSQIQFGVSDRISSNGKRKGNNLNVHIDIYIGFKGFYMTFEFKNKRCEPVSIF